MLAMVREAVVVYSEKAQVFVLCAQTPKLGMVCHAIFAIDTMPPTSHAATLYDTILRPLQVALLFLVLEVSKDHAGGCYISITATNTS